MGERGGKFLGTELLLLAAGAVAVWVTHRSWLPCEATMLNGTPFDTGGPEFSETCLAAMDRSIGFPFASWSESPDQQLLNALNTVTLLLLGLGWLALVRHRRDLGTRARVLLASAPGVLNLVLAAVAGVGTFRPTDEFPLIGSLVILVMDVGAILAVIILLSHADPATSTVTRIRIVLLALATSAASFGHLMFDYSMMSRFSTANWDSPPGSGYLTAFAIAVFAIASMILGIGERLRRHSVRGAYGTRVRLA